MVEDKSYGKEGGNLTNDPEIFKKTRCEVCHKKVATRLCDFVVGYRSLAFYRSAIDFFDQERYDTCDLPLCDECSFKMSGGWDICPFHKKFLNKIKPTKEMQRAITKNWAKELLKDE